MAGTDPGVEHGSLSDFLIAVVYSCPALQYWLKSEEHLSSVCCNIGCTQESLTDSGFADIVSTPRLGGVQLAHIQGA